jgi:hypothetical protein
MAEDSGHTKKTKDWLGRDVEEHFGENGEPTGKTRFTTNWRGQPVQEHIGPDGEKIGETRKGTDTFGRDRAVHANDKGEPIGYSRNETDSLGRPVQRHYTNSGEPVGETRSGSDWLGREQKVHKGRYFKSGEQSEAPEGSYYGGSGVGNSGSVTARRSSGGWLVLAGLAVVAIIAYIVGQQSGVTNVGGTRPLAPAGVPVYNLQCGQAFDVQIPPAVRRAVLIVPPCKCSDLSELNYDCTGWVRIMEPNSHWQMVIRNDDGTKANECVVLEEFKIGRGPQGVSPTTPLKMAGCGGARNPETAMAKTKDNPEGVPLAIPDRFTIQNVQNFPIRVSIEFP